MKIHLKTKQGLFTVVDYGRDYITLQTKLRHFMVPSSEFKCFAGGGWAECTEEEKKLFLSVVAPHMLEQTLETEAKIRALASLIDMQEKAKKTANQYTSQLSAQQVEDDEDDSFEAEMTRKDLARTPEEWYAKIQEKQDEVDKLRKKMVSIAREVYNAPLDLSKFQTDKGMKFIIQADQKGTSYRMCFDPYQFVDNFHSSISEIYRNNVYYTANGGWLKVMGDNVILYYKSGDYGVYDDTIGIACAEKLFPGKKVYSYAGQQWNSEWDGLYDDLPF